ncbi:transcription factor bHLH144 [Salvia miltiorrhiza]|uniref:transcription factor bHLH144 n=1 Tax=Salvia miltiorrhiza TaxID=226208 RepID=UPI0025ABDABD|nr:transcription factor bHLH144 [Salvia miltiorrhiza]XP_057797701.1 transcription factor bHLH144 [Salvia miltiorrhiza]
MHSNQPNFPAKPMPPLGDQVGYYTQNARMASLFDGLVAPGIIKPRTPFGNVDIQPTEACPRNFIIFDQTKNRSQIMLHPEISSKMFYPGFGVETTLFQENLDQKEANDEGEATASQLKEDSDDIDALLGTEYDEDESGDEVSTARTNAIYECSSPDSCSNYESVSKRSRSHFKKSTESCGNDKKRQRVRKMVRALRGIVPGANRMSSVAVLDEAVRYLKSLRVEVKKLGVGSSNE